MENVEPRCLSNVIGIDMVGLGPYVLVSYLLLKRKQINISTNIHAMFVLFSSLA